MSMAFWPKGYRYHARLSDRLPVWLYVRPPACPRITHCKVVTPKQYLVNEFHEHTYLSYYLTDLGFDHGLPCHVKDMARGTQ